MDWQEFSLLPVMLGICRVFGYGVEGGIAGMQLRRQ